MGYVVELVLILIIIFGMSVLIDNVFNTEEIVKSFTKEDCKCDYGQPYKNITYETGDEKCYVESVITAAWCI